MILRSIALLIALNLCCLLVSPHAFNTNGKTDWSQGMVESTMRRYPTAKDLGPWGYAKSLYLYGQYLVYKRTREPRYLKYIKDWVDYHVDSEGIVRSANAQGQIREITFENLDSMLPGNLLLILYQETSEPK
ncbi:MAG TPA: glycoside hydrolase family 88 protein, partial [Pyrinomonadaceae bacterium]|nr:glycoside hydrolase family 88 protein [Pyrinomonadaceae bacterium]